MTSTHPPDLQRLTYFYGQQLGPYDLQGEQAYLLEKHRMANRYLHGWGVVRGLEVTALPGSDPKKASPRVVLRPGLALDCHGNEVLVRRPIVVDLLRELSDADRKRLEKGTDAVWLSVCYCEQPVDPARPLYSDVCGIPADCAYARIRETVAVKVGLTRPGAPDNCESCPGNCPDPCVALARITGVAAGKPVTAAQIDNGVRRMLARHQLTTITGISFTHGATYRRDLANRLLNQGIEVRFSGLVRVDSLTADVVEVLVYTGGSDVAGNIYHKRVRFGKFPPDDFVDRFVVTPAGNDSLNAADRVVVRIKADFILDRCCRAVDGNHIGGRIPLLPGYDDFAAERPKGCEVSPDRPGAWVSGNGSQGGTFEAWFRVERRRENHDRDGY
ncbi:hypothetical protein ACIBQ1_03530 [Nonomuraea sp. NPDC050153]|uniref:hypothetical protein n=1 Tax=Nonomuraea sp. NPDC050153 TaxID=3364359 RepID=UPI0037AC7D95